jgi:hypothetical protein
MAQGFDENFVSEESLRETDDLDLIGADKDFLDQQREFNPMPGDGDAPYERRSFAFNEVVPMLDDDKQEKAGSPQRDQDEEHGRARSGALSTDDFEFVDAPDISAIEPDGADDEEDAARMLVGELEDQGENREQTRQSSKKSDAAGMEAEDDDERDDDEEANDVVVELEPKQQKKGLFSDIQPAVGDKNFRSQSSVDFAQTFVPKRLSQEEVKWKREQDKRLRMRALATGDSDDDFFSQEGRTRRVSFIETRRLGQVKTKQVARLSNEGKNGTPDQLSAMRHRAQSLVDA